MRDHQNGKINVFDIIAMPDTDEGDPGKVARLERRCASLRRDLEDASELVSPQRQAPADPLEAASRRAHDAFVEATRAALAAPPQPRREPPFAPPAAGGCAECEAAGATERESAILHGEAQRASILGREITRTVADAFR